MKALSTLTVKVADEVWVVMALLQRENPDRNDFAIDEIMDYARQAKITSDLRPGVYAHVIQHCVANRAPNSGRYRMLYETRPGRRRLFRTGDSYDLAREGAKTQPASDDLPEQYRELLQWYRGWDVGTAARRFEDDPILSLVGSGKHIWGDEHPDDYVRSLREGWGDGWE
jgi:hypothetical protein